MIEDEKTKLDHQWYRFRQLSFYISCLYDEEAITGKTYETMNSALDGLKPDLMDATTEQYTPEQIRDGLRREIARLEAENAEIKREN